MISENKIIFSDALLALKEIPDNSVDLIFTSPPYAEKRKNVYGSIHEDEYIKWFLPIAKELKRVLKPTGSLFINIKAHSKNGERSLYVFDLILALKRDLGFYFIDELCWVKMPFPGVYQNKFKNSFEPIFHLSSGVPTKITFNPLACGTPLKESSLKRANRKCNDTPNSGSKMVIHDRKSTANIEIVRPSNVLQINNVINQHDYRKAHAASFPDKLVEFFVLSYSNKGDTVLDPFAGSGTVGKISKKFNRSFILIDNKLEYYNLMKNNIKL